MTQWLPIGFLGLIVCGVAAHILGEQGNIMGGVVAIVGIFASAFTLLIGVEQQIDSERSVMKKQENPSSGNS